MKFEINLPDWASEENQKLPDEIPDLDERMRPSSVFRDLISNWIPRTIRSSIFEKESGKRRR